MKMLITSDRVRAVIAGARNEKDVSDLLRSHKIRYTFTTDPGYLAIKIPSRFGVLYVYRTSSRSAPFAVRSGSPVPALPVLSPSRIMEV